MMFSAQVGSSGFWIGCRQYKEGQGRVQKVKWKWPIEKYAAQNGLSAGFVNQRLMKGVTGKMILLWVILFLLVPPVSYGARIKDIASVEGVRDNQLIGFGLVVGLDKPVIRWSAVSLPRRRLFPC